MFTHDYIAYAMIAVGIFTFYMAVVNLFRSNQGAARIRNAADASYAATVAEPVDNEEKSSALLEFSERYITKKKPEGEKARAISSKLALAGISSPNAMTYYLLCTRLFQPLMLLAGIFAAYNSIIYRNGAVDLMLHLFVSGVLILIGLNGANIFISNARQKRKTMLTESFPEVMDLLLVCIESGLGLDAALNRVCKELREMHPEVVAELDRTRLELTMLNDRVVALQNLAERTGTLAFNTLVSSLIQTEKFGTSLVDTLRLLSEEQRITRLYAAEQKAARIPVLVTIPLILFIMPAFIMIILGPPIIKVMNQGGILGGH